MKKILTLLTITTALLYAAEPNLVEDNKLVTHTQLGYIETQGNTVSKIFNFEGNIKKGWGRHITTLSLDVLYGSEDEIENKNKFLVEFEYDYEITDRFALDYLVGYKEDKFSGFDYQAYTGPGAKYKAIITDNHNLTLDGNILYAQDSKENLYYDSLGEQLFYPFANVIRDPSKTVNGEVHSYGAYRAKLIYSWQMLENLKFAQDLSYRAAMDDETEYFVESNTAFSSKISDIFSAGISYKVDYINNAADGKEYSDRTFTANLIIDY